MNKALLVHILSLIAYFLCVGYVTQGEDNSKDTRIAIVMCLIMSQTITALLNSIFDNNKKKI